VSAGELFVANTGGTSVTEVNASTGAAVRVISGPAYQLDGPYAMAVSGDDLFVANSGGNSVTALNASTGQLVTVFSGQAYEPSYPQSNYEGQAEGGRVPLPKRAASLVLPAAVASGANCAHAK
jgi:outer membrane protein assembly factor BamB